MNDHVKRMCQQRRCTSREPAIIAKPVAAQTAPALRVATPGDDASLTSREPLVQALLSGPKGALGGGSIESQIARLSDTRLPIRQRQALAAEIGRVQGNRQLQRVMARWRENDGAQKYTSAPFSPFSEA